MKWVTRLLLAAAVYCAWNSFLHGGWWQIPCLSLCLIYAGIKYFVNHNYSIVFLIVGALMNLTAVLANHGVMPVLDPVNGTVDGSHVLMTAQTHLVFLCDLYKINGFGVFSAGDIIAFLVWPLAALLLNKKGKSYGTTGR